MEGKRFIHKIKLQNFLSYGSEGEEIELQPLNVLIGRNSAGKSNLIEAISILKATPTNLPAPFRQGGGINEFLWKGERSNSIANIDVILNYQERYRNHLHYKLSITEVGQRLELATECLDTEPSEVIQIRIAFKHSSKIFFVINDFKVPLTISQSFSQIIIFD
ncbi:MAG: AAA family ATPase [Sphaerospermopsis sp. SIO1G2]|nr:AAA family ATPase [Sphaerospermopsis sp. SIO1G2]